MSCRLIRAGCLWSIGMGSVARAAPSRQSKRPEETQHPHPPTDQIPPPIIKHPKFTHLQAVLDPDPDPRVQPEVVDRGARVQLPGQAGDRLGAGDVHALNDLVEAQALQLGGGAAADADDLFGWVFELAVDGAEG